MRKPLRIFRVALAVLACVASTACFEEPVREHVHLLLVGGETVVIVTVQEVADPDFAGSNPVLAERLDEARADIERGWDRWRPLYRDLRPRAERYSLEMLDGLARRALYTAVVESFEPIERFLGSEGLTPVLAAVGPEHELQVYPTGGTRATSAERDEVEERLDEWAAVVADYLAAAIELYAHLEEQPGRAVPCLSHVFDIHGPGSGPLDEREGEMVNRLKEAIEYVAEVLLVDDGEAYSLNQLSRLAFDPFPTRLTVSLAGEVVAADGWIEGDGYLERPPVDLWRALETLEGRWLAPDVVTELIAPVLEELQPEPDPEDFALRPRWFGTAPTAPEVAAALRAELAPPDMHAVRWRPVNPEAPEIFDFEASQLLDRGETTLPR